MNSHRSPDPAPARTRGPTATASRAGLIAAVGVATVLHVIASVRSPLIAPDGIGFIQFARELGDDPPTAIREHAQHPGYPLLILATHAVTGRLAAGDAGWEFAARLACGLSGLACVALIWLFVRRVVDAKAATVAAVVFAILPTVRQNAADALSDSTHLLLYLGAVCVVCHTVNGRPWWRFLLAGGVSGLAFWVRPEGLAVAVVSASCVLIVPAWRASLGGGRRAVIGSLGFLPGAALVAAPLVIVSGKLTGKLAGKPGFQQLQHSVAQPGAATMNPPPERPPEQRVSDVPVIQVPGAPTPWNDPLPVTAAAAVARLSTALAEVLHGILLVPLLVGIPIAFRRMTGTSFSVCLMLALVQIGLLLLLYGLGGYIDRRHLLPLVAMLMPTISLGSLSIGRWLTGIGQCHRNAGWLAPAAAVCALVVLVPRTIRPLHESHLHKLRAAGWLREHGHPGDIVGSNAVEVIYHASIDGGVSAGSLLRIGHRIDAEGPLTRNSYLVVELEAENRLPAWSSGIPAEFTPVARIVGDPRRQQRNLVIYQRGAIVQSAVLTDPSATR